MLEDELEVEVTTERLLLGPTLRELAIELAAQLVPGESSAASAAAPSTPRSLFTDAELDPQLVFTAPTASAAEPRGILLTGATGFLGAFVLAELLVQTDAPIHCLVRARSAIDGLRRLEEVLDRYGLSGARSLAALASCASPAISRSHGSALPPETFVQLARAVDTIVHSGASVNFVFPYEALQAANVAGTHEVLRLAADRATGRASITSPRSVCSPAAAARTTSCSRTHARPSPSGSRSATCARSGSPKSS